MSSKRINKAARKRVSFAASEDVREFVRESSVGEEPAWLVPAKPGKQKQEREEGRSTDASTSSDTTGDGLAWAAEHGQDFHDEWSHISIAAQQRVHETATRKSSRRRPRQGETSAATSGPPPLSVELTKPGVGEEEEKKKPKKGKTKKKKKKKEGKKTKKREKRKRGMSVMAFLRGSVKRSSRANVERALKNMMKRIAKRVKRKRDKMVADKDVDMAQVKRAVKRGRRKKQLYTIKKIRGRSLGLNSLLKRWKWAFIFS